MGSLGIDDPEKPVRAVVPGFANQDLRGLTMYMGGCLSSEDSGPGLGKFKLKNVVKPGTKAAKQTAKIAVKPAALVAASSLQAAGLRKAAGKLGKATGL